ncbi:MAG: GTP-binding protein [Candidatus Helarchaeota archaeon]|nr:GTP-binding protein [Candidatus Helarchaeota archaeon]
MDEIIKGIVFSQFNEKFGPTAIVWIPATLSNQVKDLVSMKSISIMAGEGGQVPKGLTIVPFPSINLKGLIKSFEVRKDECRGGYVDCAITLLFNEVNDLIFYKYISNFEAVFEEFTIAIAQLEQKAADEGQFEAELEKLLNKTNEILNDLQAVEITSPEAETFPREKEEALEGKGFRFKVIICGEPEVGKTSLVLRFTNKAFRRTYIPTIGVNISEKRAYLKSKRATIEFVLWDIAGRSTFQKMRKHFYQGADGVLLVFDLTRPATFQNIPRWYQDIKATLKTDMFGYLLGNKADLVDQKKVDAEEIGTLTKDLNLEYIETSALSGANVDNAFHQLAELLITQRMQYKKLKNKES